jgi:hypothetical protein
MKLWKYYDGGMPRINDLLKLATFSCKIYHFNGATTLNIMSLSIMTFSIITLSVKGLYVTLSISKT